jgi:hypothetical protein
MEANGRCIKQSGGSQNNKVYTKNLRLMANFIIERLETDSLNIEKIKIEPKFRHNSSEPRYHHHHSGTNSSSIARRKRRRLMEMEGMGKWRGKWWRTSKLGIPPPPCCPSSRASPTTATPKGPAITQRKRTQASRRRTST